MEAAKFNLRSPAVKRILQVSPDGLQRGLSAAHGFERAVIACASAGD